MVQELYLVHPNKEDVVFHPKNLVILPTTTLGGAALRKTQKKLSKKTPGNRRLLLFEHCASILGTLALPVFKCPQSGFVVDHFDNSRRDIPLIVVISRRS
eukprot:scaffold2310_cov49-Cylindrotheca_fusiformis.AAC.2